ncbi:MAG: ROK family protein [Bacteroidota bacterium]
MYVIALDVGGTNLKAAIVDSQGQLSYSTQEPTNTSSPTALIHQIAGKLGELQSHDKFEIAGIGIAMPGMINLERSVVSNPPNFPGWKQINLVQQLKKELSLTIPIALENDANAAALGSLRFGLGKQHDSFILITLGTGVGGAIIMDGKLYRGPTGMAGEMGHMIIQADGPASHAPTRGTLEAFLGQRFLTRWAMEQIKKHPDNSLYDLVQKQSDSFELSTLTAAAQSGNSLAIQLWSEAGRWLGLGLTNLVHLLDIRTFIFAGGIANAGDLLLQPARQTMDRQLMLPFRSNLHLLTETPAEQLGIHGAAALILNQLEAGQ